jgi:DNA-binding MarR family transcriptional regulator
VSSKLDNLGFLISDIARLTRRAFQERLEGAALSVAEARTLYLVSRNEGMRQVDLAGMLEVQPIAMARLIDRLQQMRLVERRPVPEDRRAYQIYLMPEAKSALEQLEIEASGLRREITEGLSPDEVNALHDALSHMRTNLQTLTKK